MPDSYVVQIYRRDPAGGRMTGTVERVGNGERGRAVALSRGGTLRRPASASLSRRGCDIHPTKGEEAMRIRVLCSSLALGYLCAAASAPALSGEKGHYTGLAVLNSTKFTELK